MLMRIRQNLNSFLLKQEGENVQNEGEMGSEHGFVILERERECLISRFSAIRIIGSRRSKKQSRSTRRGLRVGTDLVEFRKLQEVGIFSYLCCSLAKSHVNGWGCFEAWISRVFDLKTIESTGENLHCCGREQCQPEGFTVHMNSDMIFCVNFYVVE